MLDRLARRCKNEGCCSSSGALLAIVCAYQSIRKPLPTRLLVCWLDGWMVGSMFQGEIGLFAESNKQRDPVNEDLWMVWIRHAKYWRERNDLCYARAPLPQWCVRTNSKRVPEKLFPHMLLLFCLNISLLFSTVRSKVYIHISVQ